MPVTQQAQISDIRRTQVGPGFDVVGFAMPGAAAAAGPGAAPVPRDQRPPQLAVLQLPGDVYRLLGERVEAGVVDFFRNKVFRLFYP